WLSGLVALKLGLNKEQTKNTVVAALARDIGLLYLPNVLLDEEAKYGPSEWAAMKSHTMVGEIITRDIGELEEAETRGVLEHHERHDGMGYPKGIKGKHLSIIGQIVGAVDTICAIRFKRFEHSGRNLRDVYSYIQMNSSQFNPQVNSALFEILVKSGIERTMVNPFKTVDKLVSHLYVRGAAMNGVMPLMERLDKTLDHFAKGPKRLELQRVNNQVGKLINESGMLDKKMLDWLNSMDSKYDYRKVDLAELSEMDLLQNELYWQLKRVSNACQAFHDTEMNKAHPLASDVSTVLRCLSEKNLPGAASYISK
ncbi:MAG: HD domain-containing phosphohydrolase, partial [Gammaproteobacteria bacterium]|nr:HD domain-containing phosphohydrolase [Gammaproteobacteria bacterium]